MTRGMDDKSSILIVDDNVGMCETLSDIMEDRGYRTVVALDGYEAVERVREAAFDVILMDIKMPGMDGVETFREIKNVDPETAVVMMTAYAVEDLIREALREGAYGVLYKPLDMERVMSLIEDISGGRLILVVDDDPNICATLKDILEARGYKVGTASNGERAIAIAREHKYDVIFIDTRLLTTDGLETYLAIKEVNPQAVAVVMTGHRQEVSDLVEEALEKDAYTCLYKPFDVEQVIKLVDEICHRKRQRGQQEEGRSANSL